MEVLKRSNKFFILSIFFILIYVFFNKSICNTLLKYTLFNNSKNKHFLLYILFILLAVIFLFYFCPFFLKWISTQYIFTKSIITIKYGILCKQEKKIPTRNIFYIRTKQSLIQRLFNCGTLILLNNNSSTKIENLPNIKEINLFLLH